MSEIDIIKKYIKETFYDLDDETKKFLMTYISRKYKYGEINIEKKYDVDKFSILSDIRALNMRLQTSNNTSLTAMKVNKELDLLNKLFEIGNLNNYDQLVDISFELEKLYLEAGMPVRNTNTVIEKIKRSKKK